MLSGYTSAVEAGRGLAEYNAGLEATRGLGAFADLKSPAVLGVVAGSAVVGSLLLGPALKTSKTVSAALGAAIGYIIVSAV